MFARREAALPWKREVNNLRGLVWGLMCIKRGVYLGLFHWILATGAASRV